MSLIGQPLRGLQTITPSDRLKIVVIDGETQVNVIQQQTPIAPVVEVRDRNDQPAAGALVQFAIPSGRAVFANGRTLAISTDAQAGPRRQG